MLCYSLVVVSCSTPGSKFSCKFTKSLCVMVMQRHPLENDCLCFGFVGCGITRLWFVCFQLCLVPLLLLGEGRNFRVWQRDLRNISKYKPSYWQGIISSRWLQEKTGLKRNFHRPHLCWVSSSLPWIFWCPWSFSRGIWNVVFSVLKQEMYLCIFKQGVFCLGALFWGECCCAFPMGEESN